MNLITYHRKKICLVAIVKNEERFLDEWLIYHHMIGVDMFFIYDDDPVFPLKTLSKSYDQFVKVIQWRDITKSRSKKGNQLAAYNHALQNYVFSFDWVFFLDVDEFVVLRQHDTLQNFLETCDQASAVSFNWHIFGHNGFFEDPGGLVTSHLTKRQAAVSTEVKTISRVKDILGIKNPHICEVGSKLHVDANNKPFSDDIYPGKTDLAHINHYKCRSYKNWMGRIQRGDVNFDSFQDPRWQHWRLDTQRCFEQFISMVALCYNECEDLFMLRFKLAIIDGIKGAKAQRVSVWSDKLTEKLYGQLSVVTNCLKHNLNAIKASNDPQLKTLLALLLLDRYRFSKDQKDADTAEQLLQDVSENLTEDALNEQPGALNTFGIAMELIAQQRLTDIDTNVLLEDLDELLLNMTYKVDAASFTSNNLIWESFIYFLIRLRNHINVPAEFGAEQYHKKISAIKEAAKILLDRIIKKEMAPCGHNMLLKALLILDAREPLNLTGDIIDNLDHYRSILHGAGNLGTMNQQQLLMVALISIAVEDNNGTNINIPANSYSFAITDSEIPETMASTAITWSILLKMVYSNVECFDLAETIMERNIASITERLVRLNSPQCVTDITILKEIAGWGAILLSASIERAECIWLSEALTGYFKL
jgi:hypothetical protein